MDRLLSLAKLSNVDFCICSIYVDVTLEAERLKCSLPGWYGHMFSVIIVNICMLWFALLAH